MHFVRIQDRRYAQFTHLRHAAGLMHAFCTRPANVAPRTGPGVAQRAAARRTMAADLGLVPERLHYCQQVHDTHIAVVDGATHDAYLRNCDGAVTQQPDLPLMTFSADCPLVLVVDPAQRVLGMVHASWRCTVACMTTHLIELMRTRFGCRPADLLAGVGPGAGPCCYEVREDVYEAAAVLTGRERFFQTRGGRLYFDLWSANQAQLREAGLSAGKIESAGVCTLCRNDVFYSFRREGKGCGHFGLMAALVERRY
jgi:polyphenol oxidase